VVNHRRLLGRSAVTAASKAALSGPANSAATSPPTVSHGLFGDVGRASTGSVLLTVRR
jgi:hypothetical protein